MSDVILHAVSATLLTASAITIYYLLRQRKRLEAEKVKLLEAFLDAQNRVAKLVGLNQIIIERKKDEEGNA